MSTRPENTNPIPAISEQGLDAWDYVREKLRELKEKAFPGANRYTEQAPKKTPKGMNRKDLEKKIDDILTPEIKLQLTQEYTATRLELEAGLAEIALGTPYSGTGPDDRNIRKKGLLKEWIDKDALVLYSLRVEGRNRKEMLSTYNAQNNWGHDKKQTPIFLMKAKDWPGAWKDIVFLDKKVYETDMRPYMPKDSDYLLTTVHKFEVVEGNGVVRKSKAIDDETKEIIFDGKKYIPLDNALHFRGKSGAEMLWKMVAFLSGLEDKRPGEKRDDILDLTGARMTCARGEASESRPVGHIFGRKSSYIIKALSHGYHFTDLVDSVILQKLNLDVKESHRKMFLDTVPVKLRNFYDKIMNEEDRSSIGLDGGSKILPFYLECLPRFGAEDNTFNRNMVNLLIYSKDTYDAMYKKGFDQLAYRARSEGWRNDHYTLFEWLLVQRLAPIIMSPKNQVYAKDVVSARMKESGLDKL